MPTTSPLEPPPKRLLALDQGFPQNIIGPLRESIREAELVWIGDVNPELCEVEDWELLLALHRDSRDWDGLVTTDQGMLNLPKAMAALCYTRLTLVIAESAGHDPLVATGLVLANLPAICRQTSPARPQVWQLRARQKAPGKPWDHLRTSTTRRGESARDFYRRFVREVDPK